MSPETPPLQRFTERISKMLGVDPTAGISDEDIEKAEAISA